MIRSNFTAELHCQHGRVGVVETPLGAHPIFSTDQDGWLCTEGARGATASFKPIAFEFVFIEHKGNRTLYRINCVNSWEYAGAKLEKNRNGWLGLYGTHVIGRLLDVLDPKNLVPQLQHVWKVETLQDWDGEMNSAESIEFYLRDKEGYRVAEVDAVYTRSKPKLRNGFLHAGDMKGEIMKFQLRNISLS